MPETITRVIPRASSNGVNVIPADNLDKTTYIQWKNDPKGNWQIESIPEEMFQEWKDDNKFERGIAIVCGKVFRGNFVGMWLNAIDCDNKAGLEAMCPNGIEKIAKGTLVEQHGNPDKCHILFYSDDPLNPRPSVKNAELQIEVKSNGKNILYCAGGFHKDGNLIDIVGTQQIKKICNQYAQVLRSL